MKSIYIFLLLLPLAACVDLKQNQWSADLTEMNSTLDSLSEEVNAFPIKELNTHFKEMKELDFRLKNSYPGDTIDLEFAALLENFKTGLIRLDSAISMYPGMNSELVKQKNSLSGLKQDIENGNGRREKYDEYLRHERNKTNELRLLISKFVQLAQTGENAFLENFEAVRAFTDTLQAERP